MPGEWTDKRVSLVNSLITHTQTGKLKWEFGARSDQYFALLPSGSLVLSKLGGISAAKYWNTSNPYRQSENAAAATGRPPSPSEMRQESGAPSTGGAVSLSELGKIRPPSPEVYVLEVRDKSSAVIDTISSESWEWLKGATRENGVEKLYIEAEKSIRDAKDRQLGDLLNDLNHL